MALGLDYIHEIPVSALKDAGVTDVFRYLSYLPNSIGKVITAGEYNRLNAEPSITLHLNWEKAANDWLGGASAGTAHAKEAVRQARMLSYPPGREIIGSCDFDCTITEWNLSAKKYAAAFVATVHDGGYRPGVYGPWDVLGWCENVGFDYFWQSMSTDFSQKRNGKRHPLTDWWQRGYKTVNGQQCDYSDIITLSSIMQEDDVSATTDNVVDAWRQGVDHAVDAAGKPISIAPVQWRTRDEAWQAEVTTVLTALTVHAGLPAPVALTDAQLATVADRITATVHDAISANPQLSKADILDTVKMALREGTGA